MLHFVVSICGRKEQVGGGGGVETDTAVRKGEQTDQMLCQTASGARPRSLRPRPLSNHTQNPLQKYTKMHKTSFMNRQSDQHQNSAKQRSTTIALREGSRGGCLVGAAPLSFSFSLGFSVAATVCC